MLNPFQIKKSFKINSNIIYACDDSGTSKTLPKESVKNIEKDPCPLNS